MRRVVLCSRARKEHKRMAFTPSDLWRWQGRVGRTKYLAIGVTLFAVKHTLDRIVASSVFGRRWGLFNYWIIQDSSQVDKTPYSTLTFYATLLALALPFIWTGVVLTLRRLRDAGLPSWLVLLFFVPFVNLIFFLVLSVIPGSASRRTARASRHGQVGSLLERLIPRSAF